MPMTLAACIRAAKPLLWAPCVLLILRCDETDHGADSALGGEVATRMVVTLRSV
jgi:hypothetical protein